MADHEFYAPFGHIPGRFEVCRMHTASHGTFDTFIVLHGSTQQPVTVYLSSTLGAAFMAQRFPESTTVRVPPSALVIDQKDVTITCRMQADQGPVHDVDLRLAASGHQLPTAVPYGGPSVWGSVYACNGVDLELPAKATGHVRGPELEETFRGDPAVVTIGSYGRLERS